MTRRVVMILLTLFATSALAEETKPAEAKPAEQKKADAKKATPAKPPEIRSKDIKFSGGKAAAATTSSDSKLVQAAKSGSDGRGKSKLSITDADVKKSTGKLTIIGTRTGYDPTKPLTPTATADPAAAKTEADRRRMRDASQLRLEKAQKDVADLEKELARLEDDYYTEDNIDFRDTVIEERFDKTKKQLDRARSELSAARDEAQKYE